MAFPGASQFLKDYLSGATQSSPEDNTDIGYTDQGADSSPYSYSDSSFAPFGASNQGSINFNDTVGGGMGDTQIAGGYNLLNPLTWFGQADKTMQDVNKGVRQNRGSAVGQILDRRAQEIQQLNELKRQGLL